MGAKDHALYYAAKKAVYQGPQPGIKTCSGCAKQLDTSQFGAHPHGVLGVQSVCRECRRQRDRKRRGIPADGDYAMPDTCEICDESSHDRRLRLDHNHQTGKFRGWLCNRCNRAIGLLLDDLILVAKAAKYLEERNGEPT